MATLGQPLRGLYRASATVVFTAAGKYNLSIAGITVTTGTTAFEVVPNVDTRVTVEGLRDTITAGEMLPAFTVRYFDASGNPTDNGVGRVMYSRSGGSSTATIVMVRSAEGVYAVSATRATIAGNYLINVQGIPAANMTGNRDVLVRPDIPITAAVTLSTRAMTSAGARVNLSVTFRDQFGNGTDAPPQATLANQNILTSVATVNLAKTGTVGVFTTTAVVTQPGVYNVSFSVQRPADEGGGTIGVPASPGTTPRFNINPGLALRATFFNVPLAWGMNEPLAAQNLYVRVTDTLGATTNVWDGNARVFGTPTTGMRDVSFIPRDQNFDLHSGLFDVEPTTAFAVAGRYTFSLFHKETVDVPQPGIIEIPFRSYAGNRTMDIIAAPVLTSVSPAATVVGTQPWTLTVTGTGFTANSRIVLNGVIQAATVFVSPTQMTLSLPNAQAGTLNVQVISGTTRGVLSANIIPVVVYPLSDIRFSVENLPSTISAGVSLPSFTIRTTLPNMQAVNIQARASLSRGKGFEPMPVNLTQTAIGVYQATGAAPGHFFESGEYSLLVRFQSTNEVLPAGHTITVQPVAANYVELQDFGGEIYAGQVYRIAAPSVSVMENFAVGDVLQSFTLKTFDRFGNPADFTGAITLTNVSTGAVQTLPYTYEAQGVYRVQPTMFSTAGAARLSFGGLPIGTGAEALAIPLPIDIDDEPPRRTPPTPGAPPQILCVNPRVVTGVRNPLASPNIDPDTPQNVRDKHIERGYKLVWSDEFSGSALNERKWTIETGNIQGSDLGYVGTRDNVAVSGGKVSLFTRKLANEVEVQNNFGIPHYGITTSKSRYTAASIITRYKAEWRYAIVEVGTTRVPVTNGMWPAIWMMPTDRTFGIGEIDILELPIKDGAAERGIQYAHATTHWGTKYPRKPLPGELPDEAQKGHHEKGSVAHHPASFNNTQTEFSLEWLYNRINYGVSNAPFNGQVEQKIRCDGKYKETTLPPASFTTADAAQCSSYYPFNDARYFLILGSGMGNADDTFAANAFKVDGWTQDQFDIDYVRIYQLEPRLARRNINADAPLDTDPKIQRNVITVTGTGFVEGNSTVILYPLPSGTAIELETISRRASEHELLAFFSTTETRVPAGRYEVAVRTPAGISGRKEIEIRYSSPDTEPVRSAEAVISTSPVTPFPYQNSMVAVENIQANFSPAPRGNFGLIPNHTGIPRSTWRIRERYTCADGTTRWTDERLMQRGGADANNIPISDPALSVDRQPYRMPGYVQEAQMRLTAQTDNDCTTLLQNETHTLLRSAPPSGQLISYTTNTVNGQVVYSYLSATTANQAIDLMTWRTIRLAAGLLFDNPDVIGTVDMVWETRATSRANAAPAQQWIQLGAAQTSLYGERFFQMPEDEPWVTVRLRPRTIAYSATAPGIGAGCAPPAITNAPVGEFHLRRVLPPMTLFAQKTGEWDDDIHAVAGVQTASASRFPSATPSISFAPNPTAENSVCTITLPESAIVTVEVLDRLQRTIATPLAAEHLSKGINTCSLNTSLWVSGVYTIRVRCTYPDGITVVNAGQLSVMK